MPSIKRRGGFCTLAFHNFTVAMAQAWLNSEHTIVHKYFQFYPPSAALVGGDEDHGVAAFVQSDSIPVPLAPGSLFVVVFIYVYTRSVRSSIVREHTASSEYNI